MSAHADDAAMRQAQGRMLPRVASGSSGFASATVASSSCPASSFTGVASGLARSGVASTILAAISSGRAAHPEPWPHPRSRAGPRDATGTFPGHGRPHASGNGNYNAVTSNTNPQNSERE